MTLERIPTGIPGFDEITHGGLIRDRSYLVTGPSGSGKTIFVGQFLVNGIEMYNEPGIMIATEERPQHIREYFSTFGWELERLEDENMLAIVDATSTKIGLPSDEKYIDIRPFDTRSLIDQIINIQDEIGAKRAVLDSTTSIGFAINDVSKFRIELLKISTTLEILGLTSLLTCEVLSTEGDQISRFGVENFVVEGTIVLYYTKTENVRVRGIEIFKLRGSDHSKKIHPFEITENGIVVHPEEEVY
ncbi:RecA-superfamily ATPases implicated in signal transduction [Archaeoglobus sulfaticallidus PM70-1]|uniref:RecA-superfamily ATPases implicated in signal transduction n=1 Tax=Archaeoglobus sulfaticallidus PM70-1 TaxID=387631 RepID=N0BFJ0_9EURY|nr:ATPase domain-containing protein [Archaeoglobus sulfaticallidus]AGK61007.1 RecA-superfamily ATPases implicated in signal transduction [Archaeoglobus sulfaticallidus PM70-1]